MGANDDKTFELIQMGILNLKSKVWKSVSNEAKILLKKMIEVDPTKRFSAR